MDYALEAFLDGEAERRVAALWAELAAAGLGRYLLDVGARPHVTLAIYRDMDAPSCTARLQAFARNAPPVFARFSSLGVFPAPRPCVFLAPVVTRALLQLHEAARASFSDCDDTSHAYYRPGAWVPHCAMDIGADLSAVCRSADFYLRRLSPFPATLCSLGWVAVDKPVRQLCAFSLMGEVAE